MQSRDDSGKRGLKTIEVRNHLLRRISAMTLITTAIESNKSLGFSKTHVAHLRALVTYSERYRRALQEYI